MDYDFKIGQANILRQGTDITIISCGDMVLNSLKAAQRLLDLGIDCRVINMHTIKPLDRKAIFEAARDTSAIVTVETHNKIGGLGAAVAQVIVEDHPGTPMKFLGIEDEFVPIGDEAEIHKHYGLDVEGIVKQVSEFWNKLKKQV